MYAKAKYDATSIEKANELEDLVSKIHDILLDLEQRGNRELSITITKLDEALMWGKAAIAYDQLVRDFPEIEKDSVRTK